MGLHPRGQASLSHNGTRRVANARGGLNNPRRTVSIIGMTALRFFAVFVLVIVGALTLATGSAQAQDRQVPYWATLRFDEVNMRVGPSQEYKIDWVYKRKGLPVKVVRLREGWRLVEDHEGEQGWIAASQLSPTLGVLIVGEGLAAILSDPVADSQVRWRAEAGVVGQLLGCAEDFCEIDVSGRSGWVAKGRLWGAGDMEPEG